MTSEAAHPVIRHDSERRGRLRGQNAVDGASRSADERLEILQEISLALNATLEPRRLIETIVDSSIRYTGATTGSVILITDDGYLRIVAARGLGTNVTEECRLRVGQGITGWVAQHGKPLNVPDVRSDKRYFMVKEHIRSELAVPMILDRKVMGVISVDSTKTANFSDDDVQLLGIVGTQAAQILRNAEEFATLKRRTNQDETLLEISQVLGSALDFEGLFRQVMEILSHRRGMQRGCLVLVDPDRDELQIVLGHGLTPEEIARGRYQRGEGIVGRVVKSKRPIGVKDIRKEPKFLGRTGAFQSGDETVSFIGVPILLESEVVGVFGGSKVFPGDEEFDDDVALLQIVASQLAQAVKIYREAHAERDELLEENRRLRAELGSRFQFDTIIGHSQAMKDVLQMVVSVAPTRSTVLLRGESGTGKELIAHATHFNSPRADRPFVCVNCAAIPENLLEAELFGHVKGAFTGAFADRKGKFLLADRGTIFLDEIGDMSLAVQAKILRVLQQKEVDAVGSEQEIKVDVRVIAATHRDLEGMIRDGKFRADLYFRLNVVSIVVPPLRERPEDIRILAQHFLAKLRKETPTLPQRIGADALRELMSYSWPGNVRELENAVERAAILCDGGEICSRHLPALGQLQIAPAVVAGPINLEEAVRRHVVALAGAGRRGALWDETIAKVERVLLEEGLRSCAGVRLRAADFLGIHRNTLRKKADENGL